MTSNSVFNDEIVQAKLRNDISLRSVLHATTDFDGMRHNKTIRRRGHILQATLLLTLPMLCLLTTFFAFIYGFRIDAQQVPHRNLQISNSTLESDYIYVDLNSTFVILVASWMSSLAPLLTGYAITLAAYPSIKGLLRDMRQNRHDRLMTPYQLALAFKLIGGSTWDGLYSFWTYKTGWGEQTSRRGRLLTGLIQVVFAALFCVCIVLGSDTWLHIATQTVPITRVQMLSNNLTSYGFGLTPNCSLTNNTLGSLYTANVTCNIDTMVALLVDAKTCIETLDGTSNSTTVLNDGPDSSLAYLAATTASQNPNRDFTATTFGVKTSCSPITRQCQAKFNYTLAFNCSDGFQSNLQTEGALVPQTAYSATPDTTIPYEYLGVQNPWGYRVGMLSIAPYYPITSLASDPDILDANGTLAIVLACNITAYDIEYDYIQGQVRRMSVTLSNNSISNAMEVGQEQEDFGLSHLQTIYESLTVRASSAQELADLFAIAYSKISLSLLAGAVQPIETLAAQERQLDLVTRLPKAPLALLFSGSLLFVICGLVLGSMALSTGQEAREIQARFSLEGLIASLFEGQRARMPAGKIEELFEEYDGVDKLKVAIERTESGGYGYVSRRTS